MSEELFTKLAPAEAEVIKNATRAPNGKWRSVLAALGDGSVLRVRIPVTMVGNLQRDAKPLYPNRRLVSRQSDDPAFRFLWLENA